ncbi:MAG: hypothetical protein HYZ51_01695 [Candidatus Doudnabacteria bacterium]|nr:hypothetical protein [Candidatus Doudnabacteria bacterium]
MSLSAVLSTFSLASILNFTDPYEASALVFMFFYLSLFLLSFSVFTLLAFGIKRWLWPKIFVNDLSGSLRQGLLLAIFLTLAIALQLNGIFFWWLELSLLIFFMVLEIFVNLKN